ncbi:hypothetical protein M5C99_09015 [Acidovorax sp. NCPPB 2350]|nr:hypothetical protein M5C99_09015 [Acidovorax sp. NCPPB 2350]
MAAALEAGALAWEIVRVDGGGAGGTRGFHARVNGPERFEVPEGADEFRPMDRAVADARPSLAGHPMRTLAGTGERPPKGKGLP